MIGHLVALLGRVRGWLARIDFTDILLLVLVVVLLAYLTAELWLPHFVNTQ